MTLGQEHRTKHAGAAVIARDEWWDLFEVRMAERLADGDPGVFVQTLINIIDSGLVIRLREELAKRGLTIDEIMEMRSVVADAEGADTERQHGGNDVDISSTSKQYVKRLFLAQFGESQIADMLELEAARVGTYLSQYGLNADAQEIIRLHQAGLPPNAIAKKVGCSRQRAVDLVRSFGQEPVKERTTTTADQRELILKLRADGDGYTAIARKVGVDYYQVRTVCRKAAQKATA